MRTIKLLAFASILSLVYACAPEQETAPPAAPAAAVVSEAQAQPAEPAVAPEPDEEAWNLALVGHHDLAGRSSYHPVPHRYGDRVIIFVGRLAGEAVNPLTGEMETNGMSVLDITDPSTPELIHHEPPTGEAGFTQHVQICDGDALPSADPEKVYLIRTNGRISYELLDVTDPADPQFLLTIATIGKTEDGSQDTHKIQWECESGLAYLVGTPEGWRVNRVLQLFDMGDPMNPRHIRDFGLDGAQPGSTGPISTRLHQPFANGNRVYLGFGASANGVMQILDRDKLVNGDPEAEDPFAPTTENLLYPQISRMDLPSYYGAHTAKPEYGLEIEDYADNAEHKTVDLAIVVSEETTDDCASDRDVVFFVDITEEDKPMAISTFQVPEEPGDFCNRGVRFGPHSPHDAYHPGYDKRLLVLAYFNGGIRVVDYRDPFKPVEVAYYVPKITETTFEICNTATGVENCSTQVQTNNVNLDDRGYIYSLDRAGTGMHILELTGEAAEIADL